MRAAPESAAATRRRVRILAVVARIPRGRVASYGQVAALAGLPGRAREVGRVLATLAEGARVPWQRVINAGGRVSPRGLFGDERHQRRLLEAEGVRFDERGRVDFGQQGWEPRADASPAARRTR